MSVTLDDFTRTEIITKNWKTVVIDTRYVPYPLGHGYETMVFPKNGSKVNYKRVLDEKRYGESKIMADIGHAKMINKWMKEVLV